MWRRSKKSEAQTQASASAVAPVSYWATHAEPAAGATAKPMNLPSSEQSVRPRVDATLTVGGKQVDPASPEGRWLLSVGPEDKARRMLDKRGPLLSELGIDQFTLLKVLAQPGWRQHVAELVLLMLRHSRHEITDTQFDAEQRRIIGGG